MSLLEEILYDYEKKKSLIWERLKEFKEVFKKGDREIFKELCFCILTAGASATMGINCISHLGDSIFTAKPSELMEKLRGRHRYWRTRALYIWETRNYITEKWGFVIGERLSGITNRIKRRDIIALNPGIKGVGFKEASHFLRNIGFNGYAILDKHIINTMWELGIIERPKRPSTRREYLEMEEKFIDFSKSIGIPVDELDLLIWSMKTGKILK